MRGRHASSRESLRGKRHYLSAINMTELLAGVSKSAHSHSAKKDLDRFFGIYRRHHRVLVPLLEDFVLAGEILCELGWPASKKTNDVLLACCARRIGAEIWTLDKKDFLPVCAELKISLADLGA